MRSRRIAVAAAFAVCGLVPTALHAQKSAVAGQWLAEFELGVRNDGGTLTSTGNGKARMTRTAKGDSVVGT